MLNRRTFLTACTGAATLAPFASLAALLPARPAATTSKVLTPARLTFAELVGDRFEVCIPGQSEPRAVLTLSRLDDSCDTCAALEQFVLHFEHPSSGQLGSGLYTLRHPRAGSTDMRLDQSADSADLYHAAFSLLRHPV